MNVELRLIQPTLEQNIDFLSRLESTEILDMTIKFYARVGYSLPWVGYFAMIDDAIVGSAGFKGRPLQGRVEIAYGTLPLYQHRGIGTEICKLLVHIARTTDPAIIVTARTLRKESHSTKILRKNNFVKKGTVVDPEDGKVWEWEYAG
ncbi:GNAT family N-acetyltransferase [Chryseolinea sp. T2]|uniref:GNAT family N-acetyltransferase n=1 Tax=Chryseolinea sp. T2 TaxID=3129255 RepID=UPI0030778946